ncbi:hypothetical protein [Altericista sp. CCNU0014]|uniref:hypothetical protein n=1 Tax=Altericista sp. CCNU0014 TaxID=3082949 RepID=UPI0038516EC0
MELQAQVQGLIDNAPTDGADLEAIRLVAIVLGQVAEGLEHTEYYILQNFQQQWQITTLQHRTQEELQKTVLHAYGHLSDATRVGQSEDLIALPIPVVQLLFQFFSFEGVDSILFIDEANKPDRIRELARQDLQLMVQSYLEQFGNSSGASGGNFDDIA